MKIIKLSLIFLLTACSNVPLIKQDLKDNKFYKRDMIITVNGESVEGVGVFKQANIYNIEIETRGDLDLFTLESCHRSVEQEKAWNTNKVIKKIFWKKKIVDKRKVVIQYSPTELEKGYCPLRFGGYEKSLGRHSWGLVDFEDKQDMLPAILRCNGTTDDTNGASVCQSRAGFIQEIEFKTKVAVEGSVECMKGIPQTGTKFQISLPLKECVFIFMNKDGQTHRLTTVGYEHILIREVD